MEFLERLFVGYSFDEFGPHFILDDVKAQKREKLYFDSKTLSIEKTDKRFCIGTYNLDTFETSSCALKNSLDILRKENYCTDCQYKIGFNPAFYNASAISPQQERYNKMPHVVYMAYFSPARVKVGIASEKRHLIRLLEQGARAAIILGRFPDAYEARKLEEKLVKNKDIIEMLNSATKLELLTNEVYQFDKAKETLEDKAKAYFKEGRGGAVIDLSPYYFYGKSLPAAAEFFNVENQKEIEVSGKLLGMIGEHLIISQSDDDNILFPVSVKKYISHIVKIYFDKILVKYDYKPKQIKFW